MLQAYSVPFKMDVSTSELAAGMLSIEGLLSYGEKQLNIDYQPIGRHMQKLQSGSASIPLREIGVIEYKKGWYGARILLRPMRMSVLNEVPGGHSTELMFKVKRRDRAQAEVFVSRVRLELSEARMDEE